MDTVSAFLAQITGAGLPAPADLVADGQLHRYSTNGKASDTSGWYVLHTDGLAAGAFGCHRADIFEKWHAGVDHPLSADERKQHRKKMRAIKRQREEADQQRHAEAAQRAVEIMQGLQPAPPDHPYFARKGIHADVLVDPDGLLVVPMADQNGAISSLQFIDDTGEKPKLFLPGGRVSGCSFLIGNVSDQVFVTEGLATGASVHAATNQTVAVAFSASNLQAVAEVMRERYPTAQLIIAADNDIRNDDSENTGVVKARAAAEAVGALLAVPELDGRKVDFNDLHQALGLDAVKQQLAACLCPPEQGATAQHVPAPAPIQPPKLAFCNDILSEFRHDIQLRGLVGEIATAQTLYLAITSRLFDKPVSVGVKGHSSSGKSHTLDRVIEFFPDECIVKFTAMSERALVYREDDFQHRTLVIYEVTGLREGNEDDMTSYFIRSLLSEGRINYDVTVRGEDGKYITQQIVKEGPTNLIFTTTKTRVHAENETRVLSLTTDDGTEQTKNVLRALAVEDEFIIDLSVWRQLQAWLQHAEHRVTIPFAGALAELVPAIAVRLRRDFSAVLALIRSHAVLHQQTRERDEHGRIIATIDDYAIVRHLVADVVSEGIGSTVPETVRETIHAVELLAAQQGASVNEIAHQLEIDKSNASRRVRRAADGGYIRNNEDKRGQPGRWVIGDPLPESVDVLPKPEKLRNSATTCTAETRATSSGCAVAPVHEGIQRPQTAPASNNGSISPQDVPQPRNTPASTTTWTDI